MTIDRFYAERGERPIWFRPGGGREAAAQLVSILRNAEIDGLGDAPRLAGQVEAALAAASNGDPVALRRAERTLSSAWLLYVQALRLPAKGVIFGDPRLVPQMPRSSDVLEQAARAPSLERYLRAVAAVNPFYAELRAAALRQGELPPEARAKVANSLDRVRMLPASGRFVLVDVASQRLTMVEDGSVVDSMKVIVGKPDHPTPMIASTIRNATFNPYWNVPQDLLRKNIAPRVQSEGLTYLRQRGYEVLAGWGHDARATDPAAINWAAVADGRIELRVRQRPGAGNMMGNFKFAFPNGEGIYLHDTPDKALFAESRRTFSSGCVRLEDAPRLARWLMGREPVAPSQRPEFEVPLPSPVPIYVTYLTARPSGDALAFADDVYGWDERPAQRLAAR